MFQYSKTGTILISIALTVLIVGAFIDFGNNPKASDVCINLGNLFFVCGFCEIMANAAPKNAKRKIHKWVKYSFRTIELFYLLSIIVSTRDTFYPDRLFRSISPTTNVIYLALPIAFTLPALIGVMLLAISNETRQ